MLKKITLASIFCTSTLLSTDMYTDNPITCLTKDCTLFLTPFITHRSTTDWHERLRFKNSGSSLPDSSPTSFQYRLEHLDSASSLRLSSSLKREDADKLLTPLYAASASSDPYANFLLALYNLTGDFCLTVPAIQTNWWPSEVQKEKEHPLNSLKQHALDRMPEACYFIETLYLNLHTDYHDEWYTEHKGTISAVIQEYETVLQTNPSLNLAWCSEKAWLDLYRNRYFEIRSDIDSISAT